MAVFLSKAMHSSSDDRRGFLKAKFGEENKEISGGYGGNPAGKLRIMEADGQSSLQLEYSWHDLKDKYLEKPQKYSSKEARVKEREKRSFHCRFCKRKFSNMQALGGHQNAHKGKRATTKKKEKILGMTSALEIPDFISYPNYIPRIASHPIYGTNGSKSRGVLPRSMIHEPNYSWPRAGAGVLELDYHGWTRQRIVNQPLPTIDQLQDLTAERNGFKLPFKTTGFNSGAAAYFGMYGGASQAASPETPSGLSSNNENFGQVSRFSPKSLSENQELDLTLKL